MKTKKNLLTWPALWAISIALAYWACSFPQMDNPGFFGIYDGRGLLLSVMSLASFIAPSFLVLCGDFMDDR